MAKKFSEFTVEDNSSLLGTDFFAGYRSGINNIRFSVDSLQDYFFQNLNGLNGISYPGSVGDSGNIIVSNGESFQSESSDSLGLMIGPDSSIDGGLMVFTGTSGNNADNAPFTQTQATILGYLNSGDLGNIQLGTNLSLDDDGFLNASGGGGGGGSSYIAAVDFSGPWATTLESTIYLSKNGNAVSLLVNNLRSQILGTTNAANIIGSGVIPLDYRPPTIIYFDIVPIQLDNYPTFQTGRLYINTSGDIGISAQVNATPTSPTSFWSGTSGFTVVGSFAFGASWATAS